jgi:Transposase DDE domain group 1
MRLAAYTGLSRLLGEKVHITAPRIRSGAANPAPKLATLIAGMCAGVDCIDDIDVIRSGGMKSLFGGVYAPSTVGTFLREFTFGHARQLESVLREHLVALCERVDLLPGADEQVLSTSIHCYGRFTGTPNKARPTDTPRSPASRSGARDCLRWRPRSAPGAPHPVIAGMRLRAGKTGSGKGAGRMIAQAIRTAHDCGARGQILVRGDSAYGNRKVVRACRRAGARFSLVMTRNAAVDRAIAAIDDDAWTPVSYPGAVRDPDTGAWISDAEVAEAVTPLPHPPKTGSPLAWSCAGSRTPASPTPYSRCGGITRSSPTPTNRWLKPTSSTANTRSSKPCSPT